MRRVWQWHRRATRDADMVHVGLMGARPVKYMRKLRNSPAFVEVVSEVVEDVVRYGSIDLWRCGGVRSISRVRTRGCGSARAEGRGACLSLMEEVDFSRAVFSPKGDQKPCGFSLVAPHPGKAQCESTMCVLCRYTTTQGCAQMILGNNS